MTWANGERGSESGRPVSALPSVPARVLAFAAILVAGVSGGLIGYSAVKVGCQGHRTTVTTAVGATVRDCATPEGVGGLVGAVMAAVGVAVIAVLVLRAMGEWRSIREKRETEAMMVAAAAEHAGPSDAGPSDAGPSDAGEPPRARPDG